MTPPAHHILVLHNRGSNSDPLERADQHKPARRAETTVLSRRLGAPSIYSARLRPDPDALTARSAGAAAIDTLDRSGVVPPNDDEPTAEPQFA